MRIFQHFLLATCVLLFCQSAECQATDASKRKAEDQYYHGIALLKKGVNFNEAINSLREAIGLDSTKPQYHIGFACALASRFQALTLAMEQKKAYPGISQDYMRKAKEWTASHLDPTSRYYNLPEPVVPPAPSTIDDAKPFDLTTEETNSLRRKLGLEAIQSFDRAIKNCPKEDSDMADAAYAKGWGLLLLRISGSGLVLEKSQKADIPLVPNQQIVITDEDLKSPFEICTKINPNNADYWFSLGLATIPKICHVDGNLVGFLENNLLHDEKTVQEAVKYFKRAIRINKQFRESYYLLYLTQYHGHKEEAISSLVKVMSLGSESALLQYELGGLYFAEMESAKPDQAKAQFDRAMESIELGNKMPMSEPIPFYPHAPAALRSSLSSVGLTGLNAGSVLNIITNGTRTAIGYSWCSEGTLDYDRTCKAGLGFSWNVIQYTLSEIPDTRRPRDYAMKKYVQLLYPIFYNDYYGRLEKCYREFPTPERRAFVEQNIERAKQVKAYERAILP